MKKIFYAALSYLVLGLLGGLYYRELTKASDFSGTTQLSVLHTHVLTLGMLVFLVVLALENSFQLSGNRWFPLFFWVYNGGVVITTALLAVHGTLTVLGEATGAAVPGIAGIGHILLSVGLVFLFLSIHSATFHPRGERHVTASSS